MAAQAFEGCRVQVIGDVQVRRDEAVVLQAGQRQLLALLVAVGPGGATPDRLADEIWGERLPGHWPNSLRVAVHRLRKRGALPIVSEGGRYRLELDACSVDAWQLADVVAQGSDWDPTMEQLLASPDAFPSVEPSLSILEASNAIAAGQRHLIERLARLDTAHGRPFLGQLILHAAHHLTDDRLVQAVATILSRSGGSADALRLIERCRSERREAFDTGVSDDLEALDEQIRCEQPRPKSSALPIPHRRLPLHLDRYRRDELVGREQILKDLLARLDEGLVSIAIRGASGVGKTALLAELAHRSSDQAQVLYIAGIATTSTALAPLAAAIPGFSPPTDELAGPLTKGGAQLKRLAEQIVDQQPGRKTLLLIDDGQWLDSQTCAVLDFLIRSNEIRSLAGIVIATRTTADGSTPWQAMETALERLTEHTSIELEPLTPSDVEQVLGRLEPELSFSARHQKAQWLHHASAGLPEVVRRIVEIGATGPDGDDETYRVFDRLVLSLNQEVRDVGVAAAVIGRQFRLSDLMELLRVDDETLAQRLDVLILQDLVSETGSFDHFEFCHQLILDAFVRSSSRARLARFHLRACGLSTDVHAQARHRVASAELSDAALTLATVIESATQYLANRQFWESAAEFRTAIGLEGAELDPQAYVLYARAVSLAGSRRASSSVRERAYAAAVAADAWDLAVDAALSGLPEAEVPDGESDRLEQLEGISPELLSPDHRLAQALTAARLSSQLGRTDGARSWADRAAASARSDEERGQAALGRRFVQTVDTPALVRLEQLKRAVDSLELPAPLRSQVDQFRAVDHLESGRYDLAVDRHDAFLASARSTGDPLRQWHASIFGALLAELRADFARSDQLADAAKELGDRHSIAQAEIVRVAQQYFRLEALGRLAELVDVIGLIPVSDAESSLFTAATTRVLLAAGREQDATELAAELANRLLATPSVTSHGSMALLAPALSAHPSRTLRDKASAALEPFRGCGIVIGAGLGFIPTIEHLRMRLRDNSTDGQAAALRRAIDDCDAIGLTTWAIRFRLDLGELTGQIGPVEAAKRLADGTGLSTLFERDVAA